MKKNIKKATKKVAEPELILNCTNCVTPEDVQEAYIDAKVNAGRTITPEELKFVKDYATPIVDIINIYEIEMKKLPWYKRLWNWLRRK
jgi:hypothetical protein